MSNIRTKKLTLHEILEELEDGDISEPECVTIFPPNNANEDLTDEDSGDENVVRLGNLPRSQLITEAEVQFRADSSDSDDEMIVSLAELSKRKRPNTGDASSEPGTSSEYVEVYNQVQQVSPLSVTKLKKYSWVDQDLQDPAFVKWVDKTGPKNLLTQVQYFDFFFDSEVIELILKYTNLYAAKKNKTDNITHSEIMCFLGVLLLSGYFSFPRKRMYWQQSSECGVPLVYVAISRDRFEFIMANLHCCDNDQLRPNDKFAKVRPLFSLLNKNFQKFAPFEENHSFDETMCPYFGLHSCKQFIRGKPIRWGYKFWTGATKYGYVDWFQPYQGNAEEIPNEYKVLGLGSSLVLQYASALRETDETAPFHIFFDNFFTSIPLIDELKQKSIKSTGTVRENRISKCPLPSNKDLKKSERGTYQFMRAKDENIVVCKWNDNNIVTVASSAVKVEPTQKVKRFSQSQKRSINVDQPALIKKYNENMGGVDRCDQNLSLYRTSIRGKKWYFCLFAQCLDLSVQNAWQLYRLDGGQMDQLAFRRSLATHYLESYKKSTSKVGGRSSATLHELSRYDRKDHLIEYIENRKRCAVCHAKSNFICKKCKLGLHPKNCFLAYHTSE